MKTALVLRISRIHVEIFFSGKSLVMLKAITENRVKDIKCLVEHFDMDIVKPLPSSITFLHYAAMFGSPEIVEYFLQQGAMIDYKDQLGCTPLARAVHTDNRATVDVLLQAGANKEVSEHYGGEDITLEEYAHIKHYKDLYDLLEIQKKKQKSLEKIPLSADKKAQTRARFF